MNKSFFEDDSIFGQLLPSVNLKLIFIPFLFLFIGIFTLFSLEADRDLIKHIIYALTSLFVFFIIILLPKELLKKLLNFSIFFLIFLLFLVFILGYEKNGAQRWLRYSFFSIQPSELLKCPFICFVSWFFYLSVKNINYKLLIFPFSIFILILFLLHLQPDIGTAVYFFTSFFLITCLYIKKIKIFLILFFIGLIFAFLAYILNEHVQIRINEFLFNKSMQVQSSLNAINNGSYVGVGLGEGRLKYFVIENKNDFIYSIIIEELGAVFGMFIALLYPMYLYFTKKASDIIDNLFLKNTVFVLSFMTCFQAFVNISTSIDLMVPTGMPLPFISYGGSSLLSYALIFGTVVNFTKYEKSSFNQSS